MIVVETLIKKYHKWHEQHAFVDSPADLVEAAVLVPLVLHDEPTLLLNERADHLRDHAGQVCLPGGRIHATDESLLHTALRETHEENGITPEKIDVIGPMKSCETFTGFNITPFLCTLASPLELRLDPEEVKTAFEMPLSYLLAPDVVRRESQIWEGKKYSYYVIDFEGHKIWGATASILVNLLEIAR